MVLLFLSLPIYIYILFKPKCRRNLNYFNMFISYYSILRVALDVQRPSLAKWGFDASELGVTEMNKATFIITSTSTY